VSLFVGSVGGVDIFALEFNLPRGGIGDCLDFLPLDSARVLLETVPRTLWKNHVFMKAARLESLA
jgi:hypothetical protein